jgi:hypothetical protein
MLTHHSGDVDPPLFLEKKIAFFMKQYKNNGMMTHMFIRKYFYADF